MKEESLASGIRNRARGAWHFVARVGRRLHSVVSPPPILLCYHRVFEPESDPHLLSVSPDRFREQLEVVRRIAQPLALDQLCAALEEKTLPRRGVVLTFDDGYFDNLENALPLLRAVEIPATIYIATGYVGTKREFWWDDLERLTLGAQNLPQILQLQIDGRAFEWNLTGDDTKSRGWNVLMEPDERTSRQRLFCDLHAALRPLPASRQEEVLNQLRSVTNTPLAARPSYRGMAPSELKALAAETLITLGAHTISHCDLVARTPTEQQTEMAGSKKQLEEFIGRPVAHFSYPYGSCHDELVASCAASSFRSAVSCDELPVERSSHPHCLPRFLVRNWKGAEFERRLQEFFRG